MIDLDPLGTPYGPYIASVIEGEYNGLIYDNGQIWLDKRDNAVEMLTNSETSQEPVPNDPENING